MTTVAESKTEINPWKPFPAKPEDWYTAEEVRKADEYGKPLRKVLLVAGVLGFLMEVAVVAFGVAPKVIESLGVENWFLGLLVSVGVILVTSTAIGLPFSAWRELGYDKRWGFSTQTVKGFVIDQLKALPIGLVLLALLFGPLFAVIRATELWWLLGAAVFAVIQVAIGVLFPVVIFPLFNKYTPLEEGELRDAIMDAARKANADINKVLVEDSSKRDTRPNAYVAGLGKVRRVVLFDNILRYPQEAVVSVIAHEIGHWKMRHILRSIPLSIVLTFVNFAILGLVMTNDAVLDFAGVDSPGDPGALPLFLLVFGIIMKGTGLISSWLSRAHERQADLFAFRLLGSPTELRGFFHDVSVENLMDLRPTAWRRLKASHPPFSERMAMAEAWAGHSAQ